MGLSGLWCCGSLILCLLLAGCGTPAVQPAPPTPTPLPPVPALERPIFVVERGSIARVLEATGRVTPVDLVRIGFAASGRVAEVRAARGDVVRAGDVLATLSQEEAIEALQQAELAVIAAERDLTAAQTQRDLGVEQATLRLRTARERLGLVLAGAPTAERTQAEDAVADAEQSLERNRRTAAAVKAEAEREVVAAADAVVAAQDAYSDAYWDELEARGGPLAEPAADTLAAAERELRSAERERDSALLALEEARRAEVEQVRAAEEALARARRDRDRLAQPDPGSTEVAAARQAVAEAELSLKVANQTSLAPEQNALDEARLSLSQAQRTVAAGQILAPQDGELIAVSVRPGDEVEAFAPVIELANPNGLEVAAELSAEQLRELAAGQPAEIRLLSRPDLPLPARIRRLPASGSGVVRAEDRSTRFQIDDLRGQTLTLGTVARVRVVLEQKEDVLLLPPEAVRAFEGRQFVLVREGDRERRVPVRIGVETPERVEILEGLSAGDTVVGP